MPHAALWLAPSTAFRLGSRSEMRQQLAACQCREAVQVGLLLAQTRWGPRCFIPKQFLPAKYDYHRRALARPPDAKVQGEEDDTR